MEFRIKILTEIDANVSKRPTYWYSLECQGASGQWVMIRVENTLLDLYRVVKHYDLNWDALRIVNLIKVF